MPDLRLADCCARCVHCSDMTGLGDLWCQDPDNYYTVGFRVEPFNVCDDFEAEEKNQ